MGYKEWILFMAGKEPMHKIGNAIKNGWGSVRNSFRLNPTKRFLLFLIAVTLIIWGQSIMRREFPIESWHATCQEINDWLHIDVRHLSNVILGMSSTIVGGVLFAIASYRAPVFKRNYADPLTQQDQPILRRLHLSTWLQYLLIALLPFGLLAYRASRFEFEFFDPILWVLSIALLSIAVFRHDRAKGVSFQPDTSTQEIALLIFLLILGLLIGSYGLVDIPNSLKGDEGSFFETAKIISKGEYRETILGFGVYSYPILSSFIQAGVLKLFGATLWGWRFASVLPAMLTVIPLYFIGRDLFNRWIGVIASLTFISSPFLLSFARLGYNNSQSILIVALCVWSFLSGIKKNSLFLIYLGGLLAGLGFLTYTSGRLGIIILFIVILYTFLVFFRRKSGKRFLITALLLTVMGCAIIALPHFLYGYNQRPVDLRYKMLEGLFIQADFARGFFGEEAIFETTSPIEMDRYQLFYNPKIYGKLLLRGWLRSLLAFQSDELVTNHFISSALSGPVAVVFYVMGLYAILAHFWRSNSFLIFVWFGSALFLLSTINTYPPRQAHLVPVIPALALIIGLGVHLSVDQILAYLRHKNIQWTPLRPGLMLIICLAIMIAGTHQYFVTSYKTYRPDLEQVMNWAGLHNPQDTKLIYVYEIDDWGNWEPYLFRMDLTKPAFDSVYIEDVLNGAVDWPTDENLSIFVEESQADVLVPLLQEQVDRVELRTFTNRNGTPIGRALVRGTVNFTSAPTLQSGLGDLFTSRVMWIIWPLVGFELYLLYRMFPRLHLQNLRRKPTGKKEGAPDISAVIETQKPSPQVAVSKSKQEISPERSTFELGILLRFRMKKIHRNIEAKFVVNTQKNTGSPAEDESDSPD